MSLILPSRFNQQPQQPTPLDRGNSLTRGAQAIVNGATDSNAASGALMRVGGTGFARTAKRGGLAMAFRKNCYRASAVQSAIGTQTFVEFWYGYPTSDNGAKGGASEPTFVTGSSNNSTGIATMIGTTRATASTPEIAPYWGAISTWPAFNSAGEALTAGELTLLVVVRRQSGMEFWRNGVLVRTVTQAPTSYAASSFIVGAFIEDVAFWSTSSDTLLAGRIMADWTPAQVQAFSANPWQLFAAPQRNLWTAVGAGGATNTPVNPGAAAITLTGFAPTVARTASQGVTPAAGTVLLTGYAPTIGQTTTRALTPATGAVTLTGYPPSVTQSSAASIIPVTGSVALTGFAPTVSRTASQSVAPLPGQITLTGYAPTVTQVSASKNLTPAPAALVLTGFAPSVTQTGQQSGGGGVAWLNAYDQMHRRRHRKRRDDDEIKPLDVAQRTQTAPIITINPEQYIARMKKAENMVLARENAAYQRFVANLEAQASAKARALQEDDDEVLLLLM